MLVLVRNMSSKTRIINTMRNTVLLSLLLGVTWVMALLPYSLTQQYISVILNGSMGVYILGRCLVQPPGSQHNKNISFFPFQPTLCWLTGKCEVD